MRFGRGLAAASLLAVALSMPAASQVSVADGIEGGAVGVEGTDSPQAVGSAQSGPDSEPDRRLVDRESSERIDAVVIALWTIAGVMTVLLGLFLWHTSPRRRSRLAGGGSAGLSDEAEDGAEPAADEPGDQAAQHSGRLPLNGGAEPAADEPGDGSQQGF